MEFIGILVALCTSGNQKREHFPLSTFHFPLLVCRHPDVPQVKIESQGQNFPFFAYSDMDIYRLTDRPSRPNSTVSNAAKQL